MYTIKQVAEKMQISPYTLRYYDNEGLFPLVTRNENKVRLFSEGDLEWVHLVQCLRDTDMPVSEVKHYVELFKQGENTLKERYQIILKQKEKVEEEILEMNKRLKLLEMKAAHYSKMLQNTAE